MESPGSVPGDSGLACPACGVPFAERSFLPPTAQAASAAQPAAPQPSEKPAEEKPAEEKPAKSGGSQQGRFSLTPYGYTKTFDFYATAEVPYRYTCGKCGRGVSGRGEAMDVEAEIHVLETLMKSEGSAR